MGPVVYVNVLLLTRKTWDSGLESCASRKSSGKQRKRNKAEDTRKLKDVSYPEGQGRVESRRPALSAEAGAEGHGSPGTAQDCMGLRLHSQLGLVTGTGSVPAPLTPAEAALLPDACSISSFGHMALVFLCFSRC